MAKKKKCPECPAGEKWAVPYADFLSLLLALFIALYAISSANTEKVKALKEEFIKIFDYSARPEQAQPVISLSSSSEVQDNAEDIQSSKEIQDPTYAQSQTSANNLFQSGGSLEQVEEGTILKLPTKIYFRPNEAVSQDEDLALFLKRIAQIVKRMPADVKIDVRGFAQSPDLKQSGYQSNYELAMQRSLSVMRKLIGAGILPEQISFSSYGEFQPSKGNFFTTEESLKQNNRVEIYFFVPQKKGESVRELLESISK